MQKHNYNWICTICGEQFESRRKMQMHRKEKHALYKACFPLSTHTAENWKCQFCGMERFSPLYSKTYHERRCKQNPYAIKPIGHKVSEEIKKKTSETCKKNGLSGGYRKGSGRGKKGTYKGYYCDSSWELAYVIYNLDHNISFIRNEQLFPYEFEGKQHKYKPDFIEGDTYVEIKGYFTEQVRAKEKAFPFKLKYLDKNTIRSYLEYAERVYGKDFIKLYEDKDYRPERAHLRKCYCEYCNKTFFKESHIEACKLKYLRKMEKERVKAEKERVLNEKREIGLIDKSGRINNSLLPNDEWEERKNKILTCGIDLSKFGCLTKIEKATGLTRKQVKLTMERFNIQYKSHG